MAPIRLCHCGFDVLVCFLFAHVVLSVQLLVGHLVTDFVYARYQSLLAYLVEDGGIVGHCRLLLYFETAYRLLQALL